MPSFNQVKYMKKVSSVLNQDYPNKELIIIDDAPMTVLLKFKKV